jgi:hypothetical protein
VHFSQTYHPAAVQEIEKSKLLKRNANDKQASDGAPVEKQLKISFDKSSKPSTPQSTVDQLILEYVITEMRPLRTVEAESFRALVIGLCPSATVMCRQTLKERINGAYEVMKTELQSEFSDTDYICTTADLWSSANRSFLGMTAHWIDKKSLRRKSVGLACVRFLGTHSFDKIALAINQTHASFNIESKVVKTCTDNGSNMLKVFSAYSCPNDFNDTSSLLHITAAATATDETGAESSTESNGESDDEASADEVTSFIPGVSDAVDKYKADADDITLPEHLRCCSHTLNLIATTDAEKALNDKAYKKLYRQSMAKATALWNMTSRSTKAADAAFGILGFRFSVPCVTRWNSYYDATKKVLMAESKLSEVCKAVGVPALVQAELSFLKEYVMVMAPLAASLDILQGDQNCALGFVLPTVTVLKNKLLIMDLRSTKPIRDSLLAGIERRFGYAFTNRDFIMAAVTHPKFKMLWIDDATKRAEYSQLLEAAIVNLSNSSITTDGIGGSSDNMSDDDFFSFNASASGVGRSQKHLEYLNNSSKEVAMLHSHPEMKQLFLRYNTCLPSSAPVERLFSSGALVLTKKRNKLSDSLFEKLLLLKLNRNYW